MLQDIETELAVLSAVIQYGKDGWIEISDIIKCDTLIGSNSQVYFKCIEDALNKSDKIDRPLFLSSAHALGLDNIIKENGKEINKLFTPSSQLNNIRINAKRLAKLKIARTGREKLRTAMSELENVTGDENTNTILSIVEKPGFEVQKLLNSSEETGELIGAGISNYVEELIINPNIEVGISTGMIQLDKAIGGLRKGGYTLFGARPKTGKSSLGLNVALFAAQKLKIPVLFLDTEMKPKQHYPRMLANKTSIPISTIEHSTFTGNSLFKSQIREAGNLLEKLPITHERIAGKEFNEVLSIMRRWIVKKVGFHQSGQTNNCLIVYDYFKLMDASNLKNMQENQVLGFQATALSDFLGDFDIPCLAFVQLNREKDIAQSDRLSWLALAVVMLMHKTPDEIANDGYENGNRKIVMPDNYMRFAEGIDYNDYINLEFNGSLCQYKELGLASDMRKEKEIGKSGYKIKDEEEFDEHPF